MTPAQTVAARLRARPDATEAELRAADAIEAGQETWSVRHQRMKDEREVDCE